MGVTMARRPLSIVSLSILFVVLLSPISNADNRQKAVSKDAEVNCDNLALSAQSSKKVAVPNKVLKRFPKFIELQTNCGLIVIRTDNAAAPRAVTFMASLVQQRYFDDTVCHRLTTDVTSFIQCGDPTGTGVGDKVYTYQKENLPRKSGKYREGSVAIQNKDGISSQFLLFYDDTTLAPNHSIWGRIIQGMDILDYIAEGGVTGGGTDGTPARTLIIERATLR
jgi:peptidyl-prolyl cis-trans isomerase B (cyclophilin B)